MLHVACIDPILPIWKVIDDIISNSVRLKNSQFSGSFWGHSGVAVATID